MCLSLSSSALSDSTPAPLRYTADSANVLPFFSWKNPAAGSRSFVLIVDDPNAPAPAILKMSWVHWVNTVDGDITKALTLWIRGPKNTSKAAR